MLPASIGLRAKVGSAWRFSHLLADSASCPFEKAFNIEMLCKKKLPQGTNSTDNVAVAEKEQKQV
jgi:hypothetical protein